MTVTTNGMTQKVREYLNDRGIFDADIEKYGLYEDGLFGDAHRIVIPIDGAARVYNPWPKDNEPKIKWDTAFVDRIAPPFPSWDALREADVLVEGEFDCIVARERYGLNAASGTAGAGTFHDEWADCFVGRTVTLLYDNDNSGRYGMVGGSEERINDRGQFTTHEHIGAQYLISAAGGDARAAFWPNGLSDKFDLTDFWKQGYPKETLLAILARGEPYEVKAVTPILPRPEEPDLERALLGALLIGKGNLLAEVKATLSPADFAKDQHRVAYEAMVSLYDRGEDIDWKSVVSESKRLIAAVNGRPIRVDVLLLDCLRDVPTAAHAVTYAKAIRLAATRRSIITVSSGLQALGYQSSHQTEVDLVGAAQAEFTKVVDRHSESASILVPKDHLMKYHDILVMREQRDPRVIGLPTGFQELDDAVAYFPGELWYLLAAPGVGKTTFLSTLQDNLASRNIPSLFASAEQPAIQLVDRSVAAAARVDGWRIGRGLLSPSEWTTVNDVLSRKFEQPSYIYEAHGMTTAQLGSMLHVAVLKYGVKVCFVDYVQLLADDYGNSDYSRVSYISRRLAQLAAQLRITIVAACQLSRKYASREKGSLPEMSDARDSGQLEQDAFVIIGLARKPYPDDQTALLGVIKNRNGAAGLNLKLRFESKFTRFTEFADNE